MFCFTHQPRENDGTKGPLIEFFKENRVFLSQKQGYTLFTYAIDFGYEPLNMPLSSLI